jgi:flagellin-specific chaperone FliS
LLPASLEILEGALNADELNDRLDRERLFSLAQNLLNLVYTYPRRELRQNIEKILDYRP